MLMSTRDGLQIYYEVRGEGEALFLLHGWGGSSRIMRPLLNHFCRRFRVFSLDLPGFGRSSTPPRAWGSRDYAQCIRQVQEQLQVTFCHLIAHSFGGRIAIVLASQYPRTVHKLILTGSAGLPPRRGLDYHLRVYSYKILKGLLSLAGESGKSLRQRLIRRLGSADYSSATSDMRPTLVKVVNEDLSAFLPHIKSPTLLVWGGKDHATPLGMGRRMRELIPEARLEVLPGAGHFAYQERLEEFCALADDFLSKD